MTEFFHTTRARTLRRTVCTGFFQKLQSILAKRQVQFAVNERKTLRRTICTSGHLVFLANLDDIGV